MPWASSRNSWIVSWTSPASWSSISRPASGSSTMMSLASRRFTASATRCCWAPSCRFRSTRRRSASPLATILALDSRNASACLRTSSRVVWSAVSSCELCRARPTWRARSASTRSSSSENSAGHRRAFHDDQPEELTGVADGRNPDLLLASFPQERRQPDARPGRPRHPGPRHDRALPRRDHDGIRTEIRNARRALEDFAGPRVDLRALEVHGLAQRLSQLQQQLVHRDRPGQPAPEGAQDFVWRLTRAVDEAGGRLEEPFAHRHEDDRGHPGRNHGECEDFLVARGLWRMAETEYDDQVYGRDHDHEAEHRQDLHKPPSPVGTQLPALAGQKSQGHQHRPTRSDGAERSGPPHQEVEHGGDQGDGGREGGANTEPIHALAPPRRSSRGNGHAPAAIARSPATIQLATPSATVNGRWSAMNTIATARATT